MSSDPQGAIGLGQGYATALLQLHLGLGVALVVLGVAVASGGALRKSLSAVPWEETLRAAAGAASQVPLLAAFALIQARGAAPDGLSWVGLLVSSVSVFLGTFLAVASSVCGWEACEAKADEEAERPAGVYSSLARRLVSSLCAVGEAILIFGAVPSGAQLLSASLILRLALTVHAVGAAGHALSLDGCGSFFAACADAERLVPLAPLVGALALLDHIAWGPSSLVMTPLQPVLYCALAGVVQVILIFMAHHGLGSYVQDAPRRAEFDIRFFLDEDSTAAGVESLSRATATGLYLALAAGVGRILVGTFQIEASMDHLAVMWGEPLFATAALLAALLVAVYAAELLLSRFAEAKPEVPTTAVMNGNHADLNTTEDSIPEDDLEAPSTMDHFKAIVAPVISLVLALAAVHMSLPSAPATGAAAEGSSATAILASAMTAPFRYGLLAAAAAVALQVLTLCVFTMLQSGAGLPSEPAFDSTGTLQWEPESELALGLATRLRIATRLLLGGGLFLGFVGMGVRWWAPAGLVLTLLLYVLATPEARSKANSIAQAFAALAGMGLEQQRLAWEAARAKKAALQAAALEAEMAVGASSDAKKATAKAAGKAAAASWKAPKVQSSEKKGAKKKHA